MSRKRFTHFVRKVFARKSLPTGKLGLFRPLLSVTSNGYLKDMPKPCRDFSMAEQTWLFDKFFSAPSGAIFVTMNHYRSSFTTYNFYSGQARKSEKTESMRPSNCWSSTGQYICTFNFHFFGICWGPCLRHKFCHPGPHYCVKTVTQDRNLVI